MQQPRIFRSRVLPERARPPGLASYVYRFCLRFVLFVIVTIITLAGMVGC